MRLCSYLLRTKTLINLDLSNNKITGEGAFCFSLVIKDNQSLKKVSLALNKIDDANCARIIKALVSNNSLQDLNLSTNMISDISSLALEFMLKSNSAIKVLDLSNSNFYLSNEAKDQIIACPSLIRLDLRNTRVSVEESEEISKLLIKKEVTQRRGKLN